MANQWSEHYYKEAHLHKMMYDQISQTYEQNEAQWKALNLKTAHRTEIAEVIRWTNSMAKESFSAGYSYFVNMIEYEKSGSIFGAKKRMESFASANKHIAEWTRAAVTKWDKIAAEYGVTLVDHENVDIEISLMADASLLDIYRYTGSKWSKTEAKLLIKKVCEKFKISNEELTVWQKARGISESEK